MANVVTGAFGYIGKYITRRLLEMGEPVVTITTHPEKPNPFGKNVRAFPYNFDKPSELTTTLSGASTLYNTYWIRFEYGRATFREAIQNTQVLFECAKAAGIGKIVHISVTNAKRESDLPYYVGKGLQEAALVKLGVPYSIVRPALVFGKEDILVNNIAWLIRRFPVFPIFGSGTYRVQPVFVEDVARIATESATHKSSTILDAIGQESYSFKEFVELIASKVKPYARLWHVPPRVGITLGQLIGFGFRDRLLTRDELQGLMDGMLTSNQSPNGSTCFSDWLEVNRKTIGTRYSSELDRHYRWTPAA